MIFSFRKSISEGTCPYKFATQSTRFAEASNTNPAGTPVSLMSRKRIS